MIPVEVEFPKVRRRLLPEREDSNNLMLLDELDLINERRDHALIRIQNYQQAAAKYYNTNIRSRRFKEGDLVLRNFFPENRRAEHRKTRSELERTLQNHKSCPTKFLRNSQHARREDSKNLECNASQKILSLNKSLHKQLNYETA